jgi:hypothetical protein
MAKDYNVFVHSIKRDENIKVSQFFDNKLLNITPVDPDILLIQQR